MEYAAENDLVFVRTHTSSHLLGAGETPAKMFWQINWSKSRAEQAGMVGALENVQERLQCLHLIYVREGPKGNTMELLGAQPELLWHFTFCLL